MKTTENKSGNVENEETSREEEQKQHKNT